MRLWSLHPKHLDAKGLVALWRETLLARKVLQGRTKGYKHHPQLIRFKAHPNPLRAITAYLHEIRKESVRRGYTFKRVPAVSLQRAIPVTQGQVAYEWKWLRSKLRMRAPEDFKSMTRAKNVEVHPLFKRVPGERESWEKSG